MPALPEPQNPLHARFGGIKDLVSKSFDTLNDQTADTLNQIRRDLHKSLAEPLDKIAHCVGEIAEVIREKNYRCSDRVTDFLVRGVKPDMIFKRGHPLGQFFAAAGITSLADLAKPGHDRKTATEAAMAKLKAKYTGEQIAAEIEPADIAQLVDAAQRLRKANP